MSKRFPSWKKIFSEEVFSTPWMSIYHDRFEMGNGHKGNYFYLHTRGSALTIPVLEDGRIVLIRQYRYLINSVSIELPAGGVKEGQSYEEAAKAELVEETGYECGKLKRVGSFMPYNGLSDEFCSVFIASKLKYASPKPDRTEQIEVIFAAPDEVDRMISRGKINDGMSIAGWAIARTYLR